VKALKESKKESYDVVVIGSGIGGLSAAALLAKAGKSVLVVERHIVPGGCAHAFKRKGFLFDSAVHLVGGCEPSEDATGGLIDRILRTVGTRDECEFISVDPFYRAVFPGLVFDAPTKREDFIAAHAKAFPGEEDGIRGFFELCGEVNREARSYPAQATFWQVLSTPWHSPNLARYSKKTVEEVLQQFVKSKELRTLMTAIWPYLGVPPSRLSFVYFALMLLSYLDEGAYYCRGSFQRMADAMVHGMEQHGGELLLGATVRRIIVENDRVAGVRLENGQEIHAKTVISNADARHTFEELLGGGKAAQKTSDAIANMERSLSTVAIYLALEGGVPEPLSGHENFAYESWDHDDAFEACQQAKPNSLVLCTPSSVDPSLAPEGKSVSALMALIPFDAVSSWRESKGTHAEELIAQAERLSPGLRDRIILEDAASPRTVERYTLNTHGALYGWAMTPSQSGRNRLAQKTDIEGLWLSGHWTQPGGGIYGVAASGLAAAKGVLGVPNNETLFQSLEQA